MPPLEKTDLDQHLVLLAWLNRQFGYQNNRELLADMKDAEGFAEGHSHVYHRLIGRGDALNIAQEVLVQYDDNVHIHLKAMNSNRSKPIHLRYFQYLAALYTELFLHRYFNQLGEMLGSLNAFSAERNKGEEFCESDLKKLAFWMATGSGKTLIMHLNYRQFLHYNNQTLDNVLLITPNEGLSEQHMSEMGASNIRCGPFDMNEGGQKDDVRVIEITKLVEQKRGGGVSVPVEAFEGNNLIFVDEGHKGSGGEVWRRYRDDLGESGFTFEYSATFGQALRAVANDKLTRDTERPLHSITRIDISTAMVTARTSAYSISSRRPPRKRRIRYCSATCCPSTSSNASSPSLPKNCVRTIWKSPYGSLSAAR